MSTTAKSMSLRELPPTDRCRGYHTERNIRHQLSTIPNPPPPQTKTHSSFDLNQTYLFPFFLSFLCFYSWCSEFNKETERMRKENIFWINTVSKLYYPGFGSCCCTCVNTSVALCCNRGPTAVSETGQWGLALHKPQFSSQTAWYCTDMHTVSSCLFELQSY